MAKKYRYSLNQRGEAWVNLEMTPEGEAFYIEDYFLVDTGATASTITLETLSLLGYSEVWVKNNTKKVTNIILADGNIVPLYKIALPNVSLFGKKLEDQEFGVFIDAGKDEDNLLGMNILSNFDFCFLFSQKVFEVVNY